jgi:hypothetical protein
VELEEARAAIDGWFRDRSVDDEAALEGFRIVALSSRTTADELGELRLRFVDYLMATRNLDRAAAVKIASVRMDAWFAGARQQAHPGDDRGPDQSLTRVAVRAGAYGLFAALVAWVVLRVARGEGFAVSAWFWVVEIVGSIAIATLAGYFAPERLVPAVYAATPAVLAGVLLLAGA